MKQVSVSPQKPAIPQQDALILELNKYVDKII